MVIKMTTYKTLINNLQTIEDIIVNTLDVAEEYYHITEDGSEPTFNQKYINRHDISKDEVYYLYFTLMQAFFKWRE